MKAMLIFLDCAFNFFPDCGSLGSGQTWVGYYYPLDRGENYGWFGFLSGKREESLSNDESVFVITTNWEPEAPKDSVDKLLVRKQIKNSIGSNDTYSWILNLHAKHAWDKTEDWQERLKPFVDILSDRRFI